MPPIDYDRIYRNGWRQGSVFAVDDSRNLLAASAWRPQSDEIELPPETRLIVASHSCDVVSKRGYELNIEVCPALPLPSTEKRGIYGYARDARRLRIPMLIGEHSILFDLHAPMRFAIARSACEELKPDAVVVISEEDIDDYTFWLAARVRRRVFPNTFDLRLDTANGKRIRKALQKVHEYTYALLYSLSTSRELDEGTPYRLRIVILAKSEAFQGEEARADLETAKDQIQSILTSRPGIILENIVVASAAQMTFDQYRTFSRWGFEDVSLEEGSELPPP